jgi:hypothetical protein
MRAPTQLYRHQRVIIHIIPPRLYYYNKRLVSSQHSNCSYIEHGNEIYTYVDAPFLRVAGDDGARCLGDDELFNSYWQPKGESSRSQNPKYIYLDIICTLHVLCGCIAYMFLDKLKNTYIDI